MRIKFGKIAVVAYCVIAYAANTEAGFARGAGDIRSGQNKPSQTAQWPVTDRNLVFGARHVLDAARVRELVLSHRGGNRR